MTVVPAEYTALILEILSTHIAQGNIFAFGSRVRGTARATSDLDLAIEAPTPLSMTQMAHLREEFAESNLPFPIDLVDLRQISIEFADHIRKHAVRFCTLPQGA